MEASAPETKSLGIEDPLALALASQGMAESLASLTFDRMKVLAAEYEARLGSPDDLRKLTGMRLTLLFDPLVFCVIQYRLWAHGVLGTSSYGRFEGAFDSVILKRLTEEAFEYNGEEANRGGDRLMLAQSYGVWLTRRHAAYQPVLTDKNLYGQVTGSEWFDEVFIATMVNRELVALGVTPPEDVLKALAREVVAEVRNRLGQISDIFLRHSRREVAG